MNTAVYSIRFSQSGPCIAARYHTCPYISVLRVTPAPALMLPSLFSQCCPEDDDDMYQMCLTLARDTATAAAAAAAAAAIAESYLPPAPSFPTPPSQHAPSPFTNAPSTTTTPSRHHRSSSDGQQQHSLPSFSPFPAPHSSATNWPYSPSPALDAQQQQPQHQQQRQNSITDSFYGSGNLFPLRTSQHSPMMAPGSLAAGRSLHSVSGRRMGSHMLQMQNGLTPGAYITDSAGAISCHLVWCSRRRTQQDYMTMCTTSCKFAVQFFGQAGRKCYCHVLQCFKLSELLK